MKLFGYVHTNIIANDVNKLTDFYKNVLRCKSIHETRDLSGAWVDSLTVLNGAHIVGEHLLLPGYGEDHPILEIFSYDEMKERIPTEINRPSIAHIAFEVDDVEATLSEIINAGGSALGELVTAEYPNNIEGLFVYTRDPEGNIIELQSWRHKKALDTKKTVTLVNIKFAYSHYGTQVHFT